MLTDSVVSSTERITRGARTLTECWEPGRLLHWPIL